MLFQSFIIQKYVSKKNPLSFYSLSHPLFLFVITLIYISVHTNGYTHTQLFTKNVLLLISHEMCILYWCPKTWFKWLVLGRHENFSSASIFAEAESHLEGLFWSLFLYLDCENLAKVKMNQLEARWLRSQSFHFT